MMNEWSRLKLVTASATPPVTLDQAKRHLRITHSDEDADVQMYLDAAIAAIEGPNGIGVLLSRQTWRLSLDGFPCEIILPMGPVASVESITYRGEDGEDAPLTTWRGDLGMEPVRIWPAYDTSWPVARCEPGSVRVEFVAGYETCPADLRAAVLLMTAHLFEHREAVSDGQAFEVPMAATTIMDRHRVGRFA